MHCSFRLESRHARPANQVSSSRSRQTRYRLSKPLYALQREICALAIPPVLRIRSATIRQGPITPHQSRPGVIRRSVCPPLQSGMPPRTGDITLELDTLRLVVNPQIGASIVSLQLRNDRDQWAPVLREMPQESTDPADAGSFLMLPWTNRVKDASFRFEDQTYTLTPNHSDGTAIHGIGRDRAWSITDRSPITARMTLDTRDDPASPYPFGGVVRYEVGPDRVEIDLSITNLGQHPIPVGCGHHPYFHRHIFSDADRLRVQMGVTGRYACDDCIPSGEVLDDETCASLRDSAPIGNPGLDDVFAGFNGQAVLEWAASNVRMRMRCDDAYRHVVIYTPKETDGSPNEYVCIEPVTMVNDGFNLMHRGVEGTGVRVLQPGETLRTTTRMVFETMS
ncbi:MAG: hypothetical protein CMJ35_04250 [Phycisphaerae bacterium]|nr:hypothetical protein [Phycisphaerae bacterium]MBM90811.1 hypothetical protein [Phycisphaerae bacterium]